MIASASIHFIGRVGGFIGNMLVGYLIDDYCQSLIGLVAAHIAGKLLSRAKII